MQTKLLVEEKYIMDLELTGAETTDEIFLKMREKKPSLWLEHYHALSMEHKVVGFDIIREIDRSAPLRKVLYLDESSFNGLTSLNFFAFLSSINFRKGCLMKYGYAFQAVNGKEIDITCRDTGATHHSPNIAVAKEWAIERERKKYYGLPISE